jgi:hypothetical protein
VGEVYNLAFETINRAKHDSVVVLEDCKDLKAIVGNPNGFASVLEVCADLDVEFALPPGCMWLKKMSALSASDPRRQLRRQSPSTGILVLDWFNV